MKKSTSLRWQLAMGSTCLLLAFFTTTHLCEAQNSFAPLPLSQESRRILGRVGQSKYWQRAAYAVVLSQQAREQPHGQTERSPIAESIYFLGSHQVNPACPVLVDGLGYFAALMMQLTPARRQDAYPAVQALVRIGAPCFPYVIDGVAERDRDGTFKSNAYSILSDVLPPDDVDAPTRLVRRYSEEYRRQAARLRELAKELPASIDMTPPASDQKPLKSAPEDPEAQVNRLARILELHDTILEGTSTAKNEAQIVASIEELGKLNAIEASSALADKLDWEVGPGFPEDKQLPPVNAATLKGPVSPAITEAAKRALEQIGPAALPAIMDAAAMRYRLPRGRKNALALVVKLSGGEAQARTVLEAHAQEDEAKSGRLRAWVKELTQPATATPTK